MKKFYLSIATLCFLSGISAQTVIIEPSQDNTIYQNFPGNSNGAGINLFSGSSGGGSPRRALLKFDIASVIPASSTITSVTLSLLVNRTNSGNTTMELHRLSQNWGEGASNAGNTNDGDGAA